MSGHRTKDRAGFTAHTGSVSSPYDVDPEDINTMQPGMLEGD
jgi:hypothetical protein